MGAGLSGEKGSPKLRTAERIDMWPNKGVSPIKVPDEPYSGCQRSKPHPPQLNRECQASQPQSLRKPQGCATAAFPSFLRGLNKNR